MSVEHEVKAPLFVKLICAVFSPLYILVLSDTNSVLLEFWRSYSLIGVIAFLIFAIGAPVGLLMVFFTRTVFTDVGVTHRNFILRKTHKTYEEIESVEITKRHDIRLHFRDGTSIKVPTGQDQMLKTLQVLEKFVNLSPK